MSNVPYVTTDTLLRAYDITNTSAVATTAATASSPYGYSEAQANEIVTKLNLVIANQILIVNLLKAGGVANIS